MSQSNTSSDIETALRELEEALRSGSRGGELDEFVTLLDDVAFAPQMQRATEIRRNEPLGAYEIPNRIKACMRLAERRRDESDTQGRLIQVGALGLGSALVVGGVVAALGAAAGLGGLIPALGGIAILGIASLGVTRAEALKSRYKQLAERLAELHKELS